MLPVRKRLAVLPSPVLNLRARTHADSRDGRRLTLIRVHGGKRDGLARQRACGD